MYAIIQLSKTTGPMCGEDMLRGGASRAEMEPKSHEGVAGL